MVELFRRDKTILFKTFTSAVSKNELHIGSNGDNYENWRGTISEVVAFNRELTVSKGKNYTLTLTTSGIRICKIRLILIQALGRKAVNISSVK